MSEGEPISWSMLPPSNFGKQRESCWDPKKETRAFSSASRLYIEEAFMLSRSVVFNILWPPWTTAHLAPLSMELSRQEYWCELPFPPPEDIPNPEFKSMSHVSPALADRFSTTEPAGKPKQALDFLSSPPSEDLTKMVCGIEPGAKISGEDVLSSGIFRNQAWPQTAAGRECYFSYLSFGPHS